MQLGIYEILEKVDAAPSEEEKIILLRHYRSKTLVDVLMGAFDKRIVWLLPEGPAPYRPSIGQDMEGALYHEARKMPYFVANAGPAFAIDKQAKREIMFVQFLESLHPKDADLMNYVKDKKLPYKTITPELVFGKAFPEIGAAWVPARPLGNFQDESLASAGIVQEPKEEPKEEVAVKKKEETPKVEASDVPKKRGRGRPPGALNKKTIAKLEAKKKLEQAKMEPVNLDVQKIYVQPRTQEATGE